MSIRSEDSGFSARQLNKDMPLAVFNGLTRLAIESEWGRGAAPGEGAANFQACRKIFARAIEHSDAFIYSLHRDGKPSFDTAVILTPVVRPGTGSALQISAVLDREPGNDPAKTEFIVAMSARETLRRGHFQLLYEGCRDGAPAERAEALGAALVREEGSLLSSYTLSGGDLALADNYQLAPDCTFTSRQAAVQGDAAQCFVMNTYQGGQLQLEAFVSPAYNPAAALTAIQQPNPVPPTGLQLEWRSHQIPDGAALSAVVKRALDLARVHGRPASFVNFLGPENNFNFRKMMKEFKDVPEKVGSKNTALWRFDSCALADLATRIPASPSVA